MKLQFYISPFFISKYYLYNAIAELTTRYHLAGRVLDVGCGEKPYRSLFCSADAYLGIDFRNYSTNREFDTEAPDYLFDDDYANTSQLPFANNAFDHAVAFQVLEHHKKPEKLINEMARVTKPKGYVMISVPFLAGLHEEPVDFQRYTKYGLKRLCEDTGLVLLELKELGALPSVLVILVDEYLCAFVNQGKVKRLIGAAIYPPFLLTQYLCLVLDRLFRQKLIVHGYVLLAQKE